MKNTLNAPLFDKNERKNVLVVRHLKALGKGALALTAVAAIGVGLEKTVPSTATTKDYAPKIASLLLPDHVKPGDLKVVLEADSPQGVGTSQVVAIVAKAEGRNLSDTSESMEINKEARDLNLSVVPAVSGITTFYLHQEGKITNPDEFTHNQYYPGVQITEVPQTK